MRMGGRVYSPSPCWLCPAFGCRDANRRKTVEKRWGMTRLCCGRITMVTKWTVELRGETEAGRPQLSVLMGV